MADPNPADPTVLTTDEGLPYQWHSPQQIVNLVDPTKSLVDARRRELHVAQVTFSHVADDAEGRWLYRAVSQ